MNLQEEIENFLNEETSKYKKGEFGYWWTVTKGNEDIEGKVYNDDIDCSSNKLTSLKGAPKEVKGDFSCEYNKLSTLEGSPEKVGGAFDCSNNNLNSLKGSPKNVKEEYSCDNNRKQFTVDDVKKVCNVEGHIILDIKEQIEKFLNEENEYSINNVIKREEDFKQRLFGRIFGDFEAQTNRPWAGNWNEQLKYLVALYNSLKTKPKYIDKKGIVELVKNMNLKLDIKDLK